LLLGKLYGQVYAQGTSHDSLIRVYQIPSRQGVFPADLVLHEANDDCVPGLAGTAGGV
jgi:hypothetical protein